MRRFGFTATGAATAAAGIAFISTGAGWVATGRAVVGITNLNAILVAGMEGPGPGTCVCLVVANTR